jgi:hypothetical protein
MLPPRRLSCTRETAALLQPYDVAMNQTYLAAVPAIGFVQVWFSPAQVPFAASMSETPPMPADDRLRPEDCNRAENGREPAIEPNQQKAIGIVKLWSLRYLTAKYVELLAKD